ncbi:MAG: bacillithiol system redox-active protein YtxJ [Planctomycetota bacterium]
MIVEAHTQADIDAVLSANKPSWVFKHSATCPISLAAMTEVETYLLAHADEPAAMVVVQRERALSNWISTRLGRVHQSPQLFLISGGAVVWSASHWSITADVMGLQRAKLAQ